MHPSPEGISLALGFTALRHIHTQHDGRATNNADAFEESPPETQEDIHARDRTGMVKEGWRTGFGDHSTAIAPPWAFGDSECGAVLWVLSDEEPPWLAVSLRTSPDLHPGGAELLRAGKTTCPNGEHAVASAADCGAPKPPAK